MNLSKILSSVLLFVSSAVLYAQCQDSSFFDSSAGSKGQDTDNVQTRYNIVFYSDNIPAQQQLAMRFLVPDNLIGNHGTSHDSNYGRYARNGQFDIQSTDSRDANDMEQPIRNINTQLSELKRKGDSKPYSFRKSAQMLYELLKPYSSYGSDFKTVYKMWFGQ